MKNDKNKEIIALDDFEHCLERPTMYIGSVEKSEEKVPVITESGIVQETKEISVGFYKLMTEILDNAFDEAKRMKGHMKSISIEFDSTKNDVIVKDSGGGFLNASVINKKTKITNVASAMSRLRAGSNFKNDFVDENLIGTNGVGASVVNMLSDSFFIRTVNEEEIYEQTWNQFVTKKPYVEKNTKRVSTGTMIRFCPRRDVFKDCVWDKEYIHSMMVFKNFLKKTDPVIGNLDFECVFDGEKLDLDPDFFPHEFFSMDTKVGTVYVWESFSKSTSVSFVNGALCGGIHQRIFEEWFDEKFQSGNAHKFYEMFIVLNLSSNFVRFGDQNKTRFVTSRGQITPVLEKYFKKGIDKTFPKHRLFEKISKKIEMSEKEGDVRNLRSTKRAQKKKISDKYFPPSKKTTNLFIVEGGSALGSLMQKRNPEIDAVYALKGKIKNARKVSDLTSNAEIVDLMNILNLDPENDKTCSYEKIIISADADPDGIGHIASLVINLFYKWFPSIIRQGKLYILQTPLLSVSEGKKTKYFYSMKDFERYSKEKKPSGVRYLKGLGSLSKNDWEIVFSDMRLFKIAEDSRSSKMMEMAFGTNSAPRKKWLQS